MFSSARWRAPLPFNPLLLSQRLAEPFAAAGKAGPPPRANEALWLSNKINNNRTSNNGVEAVEVVEGAAACVAAAAVVEEVA